MISTRSLCLFLAATCSLLIARPVSAQCAGWLPGYLTPSQGTAYCSVAWDPDGAGPQSQVVVVGGHFTALGTAPQVLAQNIGAWNGASWQPIGAGLPDTVISLGAHNNQLFAATAGLNARLYAWTGSAWSPCPFYGYIESMISYNGKLYIGGRLDNGPVPALPSLASWDGSNVVWIASATSDYIFSLAVYNNELVVGGRFQSIGGIQASNIARWNGTTWNPLGTGIGNAGDYESVNGLSVHNGELIARGNFARAGGFLANDLARWDGVSWHPIANSFNWFHHGRGLASFGGELYVGGVSGTIGGTTFTGMARWNGATWSPLRSGGPDLGFPAPYIPYPYTITPFQNQVLVAGRFSTAGGLNVEGLATWNGAAWLDVPGPVVQDVSSPIVNSMVDWNGRLVLGGRFDAPGDPSSVLNLASWDGLDLSPVANARPNNTVIALLNHTNPGPLGGSTLYAGGLFTSMRPVAGQPTTNRIAMLPVGFDTPLGDWQAMGAGFDNTVWAIEFHNGSIYAAGDFTLSGATAVGRVARWTGSTWLPVGQGFNGNVRALKSYNGSLYAGGFFTASGAAATGGFARFDGTNWVPVGGNFVGNIYAMTIDYQSRLTLGGLFTGINGSPNLAYFNGSNYGTYGNNIAINGVVSSVASYNNSLVIGGPFNQVAGATARRLARYNGSTWSEFGGGAGGSIGGLLPFRGELQVGGSFSFVNNSTFESPYWVRYSDTGIPWVARQPSSATRCAHDARTFSVDVADGYPGLAYAWRRNGALLANGPTGSGSTISGVTTPALTITNLGDPDEGAYTCTISNTCGSIASSAGTLRVCVTDHDCNGSIEPADVSGFVATWFNDLTAGTLAADHDRNGLIEPADVSLFVTHWFAEVTGGC